MESTLSLHGSTRTRRHTLTPTMTSFNPCVHLADPLHCCKSPNESANGLDSRQWRPSLLTSALKIHDVCINVLRTQHAIPQKLPSYKNTKRACHSVLSGKSSHSCCDNALRLLCIQQQRFNLVVADISAMVNVRWQNVRQEREREKKGKQLEEAATEPEAGHQGYR